MEHKSHEGMAMPAGNGHNEKHYYDKDEGSNMSNGITTEDTAGLSLLGLLGGGYGGYGYGRRGGYTAQDPAVTLASNAASTEGIKDLFTQSQAFVRENQRLSLDNINNNLKFNQDQQFQKGILDSIAQTQSDVVQLDRRTSDAFAEERMRNQECCCELRAGQAELKALIECNTKVDEAYRQGRRDTQGEANSASIASLTQVVSQLASTVAMNCGPAGN